MEMKAKAALLALALAGTALLAGCETTRNVVMGIADGIPKDVKATSENTWAVMSAADTWVRERLW